MNAASTNGRNGKLSSHVGGRSKVERYKWVDVSAPGVLMFIPKTELRVEERYQRDLNADRANAIARDFSWPAFGVLLVALRAHVYWIVNGQHRHAASLKRHDVNEVPCIVFESASLKDEAGTFLASNAGRPVGHIDRFRAELISESASALLVNKLIASHGLRVAKAGPGSVACVKLLAEFAERLPEQLERMWPIVVELSDGRAVSQRIVASLMYIESRMPEGESLADARWRKKLVDIGVDELLGAASKAAAYHTKGGATVWSKGIVDRLNKCVRHDRALELRP